MRIALTLVFSGLLSFCYSQNEDCATAIEIFTKDPITIDTLNGLGEQEILENACDLDPEDVENNTVWFKFKAHAAGNLLFTITPLEVDTDIDFYLFKAITGTCSQLAAARCVATSCEGPMGLSEDETETFEDLNCDTGENGFVRDVFMNKNEIYYLVVDNFTSNQSGFEIEFCGTVLFSEQDTVCNGIESNLNYLEEGTISIFPNPASDYIQFESPYNINSASIYSSQGRLLRKEENPDIKGLNINLPKGLYFLSLDTPRGRYNSKLLIND